MGHCAGYHALHRSKTLLGRQETGTAASTRLPTRGDPDAATETAFGNMRQALRLMNSDSAFFELFQLGSDSRLMAQPYNHLRVAFTQGL